MSELHGHLLMQCIEQGKQIANNVDILGHLLNFSQQCNNHFIKYDFESWFCILLTQLPFGYRAWIFLSRMKLGKD